MTQLSSLFHSLVLVLSSLLRQHLWIGQLHIVEVSQIKDSPVEDSKVKQYTHLCGSILIAFPDDGAWKQFHKQLQHFPVVSTPLVIKNLQRNVDSMV
ncbi:hypothetical protein LOK49_LG08G00538 [Camellia lanceoleosa]|uniref:Uncharacterized protein n=1 Tax=Camellia lanceoleosa TaxID=1840588 RepID=A0ACC0GV76_9ERIC|nr:hypothetical protein LOK49_LG08G00538 [Camellia lanceoleosa]